MHCKYTSLSHFSSIAFKVYDLKAIEGESFYCVGQHEAGLMDAAEIQLSLRFTRKKFYLLT